MYAGRMTRIYRDNFITNADISEDDNISYVNVAQKHRLADVSSCDVAFVC